jgi:hypothetical protein
MGKTVRLDIYSDISKTSKDLLWQRRVYKKDDMRAYRFLCRELDKLLYVKKGRNTRYYGARSALSSMQNCVVKLRIGKDAVAHKRFISEYLPQQNKQQVIEKPLLFSDGKNDAEFLENYNTAMTGKHFKFIISPENSRVDTNALVKTLIKRMETITGKSFHWMAAVHKDTDHPHAHLLINGTDKEGNDIIFDKLFITQTMREMTRQICTEMIGKRSKEEIKASFLQSYKSNRYCSFDDAIREIEEPLDEKANPYQSRARTVNELIHKRLSHLAEMGLAQKKKGTRYTFLMEKNWVKKLKSIGRYNSFLKARSELRTVLAADMELYTDETGGILGTITKLYKMNDEDSWNHALVVENKAMQKAWYIPLYFEPDDKLLEAEIACELKKNQKGLLVPHIIVKRWNNINNQKNQSK